MNTNSNFPSLLTTYHGTYPIFFGPVLPEWVMMAEAKSFDLVARIIDRLHLALRCRHCRTLNKVKLFTLRSAQPLCHACIEAEWRAEAAAAGVEYLGRAPHDRHYAIYRAPCGHEITRQFGLIKRVAAGATGIRCETCHTAREHAEAQAQGWDLIGPDADGDPNYRLYRHDECGHVQRVARTNMQSHRFSCGNCGEDWPAAPSFIYAMSFTVVSGREIIKLGFSRNPESRLHYQLKRDPAMPCTLLAKVPVATGRQALQMEKRLHAKLSQAHPELVVDPALYRDQIRVNSEIYDAQLTSTVLEELARIEAASDTAAA